MLKRQFVIGLIVALSLAACSSSDTMNETSSGFVAADGSAVVLDETERAPATGLNAQSVDGKTTWDLAAEAGNVVLLNTWGPWCAPCRAEVPYLQEISVEFSESGLQVIGMATRTNQAAVEAFIRKQGVTYLQLADYDSKVMVQLEGVPSTTVPSTIFIDRKGRVAGWALGAVDEALLRSIVKSLLEEK